MTIERRFLCLDDLRLETKDFPPSILNSLKEIKGIIISRMISKYKESYSDIIKEDQIESVIDQIIAINNNESRIERNTSGGYNIVTTVLSYNHRDDPDLYEEIKEPLERLFSDVYYETKPMIDKFYNGNYIINFSKNETYFALVFSGELEKSINKYIDRRLYERQEEEIKRIEKEEELDRLRNQNKPITESVQVIEESVKKVIPSDLLKNLIKEFLDSIKKDNISQTKLNTISNVISKETNNKVKITLDNKDSGIKFIIPEYTDDFISRFMEGRESFIGFIKQNNEIHVSVNKEIFLSMKSEKDIMKFYSDIINYYENEISKNENIIRRSLNKLDIFTKRIFTETKLNCFIKFILDQLVLFDDYKIEDKILFHKEDIDKLIDGFKKLFKIKDPKSKNDILDDLIEINNKTHYKHLGECIKHLKKYYNGEMDKEIERLKDKVIKENTENGNYQNYNHQMICESFGVKRLKKLPRDIITYITIETEAITSSNDKMMIASYCVSKLEICEWYIALLEADSKKYIVPHNKPYLEWMRTALLKCYKDIMDKKVINPKTRPIVDIDYPSGYEG